MAKHEITNYGFGQMGSAHSKTASSIYAPKGMVIVAVQFLADNVPTVVRQASEKGRGNFECITTIGEAHANGNTVATIPNGTGGTVTHVTGSSITIATANPLIKVGDKVIEQNGTGVSPSNLLLESGDVGSDGCFVTKIVSPTVIQLSKPVFSANGGGTALTFMNSEGSGAGGEDADSVKYPKGMVIYGRWSEIKPQADADGGVICYYGY